MLKRLIGLVALLLTNSAFAAQCSIALFDTIAPDYDRASDLCLFHQFGEAEILLTQIIRQPAHPNRDVARLLLTEEVYLWRGLYQKYVRFADSTGLPLLNYTFAKMMLQRPAMQIELPVDSTTVGFRVKKKGHVIVEIMVNGKPRKFMVDTGCQRSVISTKLANELQLARFLNDSLLTH